MTGIIYEEWLRWLDNLIVRRKVLLLLDNFSSHELGVEKVGGLDGLPNVKIR
jgi:DDE superfamily endonuclease